MPAHTERRGEVDLLEQLGDELKLQAWLATAELRNPSLRQGSTRSDIDALARMRDELRVQLHLGAAEARQEFARLDQRWRRLMGLATAGMDEAGESVHDVLREIRDGYHRLWTGHA